MVRLQVVGGGRMGEALVGGLLAAGWANPGEITIVERLEQRRAQLQKRLGGVDVRAETVQCDGAVVAVKPDDVRRACASIAATGAARVLSIAAGVPTSAIEDALGAPLPVVRAMPNTPALVRAGASALAGGAGATERDISWAEGILGAVGVTVRVPERLLDAVTGLSGSGPAYVFLMAETLVEAGVRVGLDREVAETLAYQTLLGASRMLLETGEDPASLRAAVTSPGGTTEAGLRALEDAGFRAAVLAAVEAATARSRELGQH